MAKINIPYAQYVKLRERYRTEVEPMLRPNADIIYVLRYHCPKERIIVTKRPIHEMTHLKNTISWLRRSGLPYGDLVYWNKNLHDLNIPFQIQGCKAAVEDNFKIANFLAERFDIPVFVVLNDSNDEYIDTAHPKVVYGDADALREFMYRRL